MKELKARWQTLRAGGPIPGYDHFRPETMWDVVGAVMLVTVETRDPPLFRFRLYGSGHASIYGQDMTGKTVQDFGSPDLVELVQRDYETALREPRAYCHVITLDNGKRKMVYDRLILPLAEDGKTIDTLFVVSRDPQIPF